MALRPWWLAVLTTGCLAEPPRDFYAVCEQDRDCATGLRCLHTAGQTSVVDRRCTRTCATVDDCPRYTNDHCGNTTTCDLGVCHAGRCL